MTVSQFTAQRSKTSGAIEYQLSSLEIHGMDTQRNCPLKFFSMPSKIPDKEDKADAYLKSGNHEMTISKLATLRSKTTGAIEYQLSSIVTGMTISQLATLRSKTTGAIEYQLASTATQSNSGMNISQLATLHSRTTGAIEYQLASTATQSASGMTVSQLAARRSKTTGAIEYQWQKVSH